MIYHPLVNSWKTALVAPPTTNPIIAPIISVLIQSVQKDRTC